MNNTVEITWNTFEGLLEDRRREIESRDWAIPDCIWDYALEILRDCGGAGNPENNDPNIIVDNIAINSCWEDFDEIHDYLERAEGIDLSDEEIIDRYERDCTVFPEERIVLHSLG